MINPMIVIVTMLVILALLVMVPVGVLYTRLKHSEKNVSEESFYKKSRQIEKTLSEKEKIIITEEYQQRKTWFDWSQLLIIPILGTLLTIIFGSIQYVHSEQIALDQQRQTTLETYLNRMSDFMVGNGFTVKLHDSTSKDQIRKVARAATLVALSRVDSERKRVIVQFLYETDLITWHQWSHTPGTNFPVINLFLGDFNEADLSGAFLDNADLNGISLINASLSDTRLEIADLDHANLKGADLSGANLDGCSLTSANLSGANLRGAHLQVYTANLPTISQPRDTNLSGADLSGADLSGANLSGTIFKGADMSGTNLKNTNLTGAIMPDGSKHR